MRLRTGLFVSLFVLKRTIAAIAPQNTVPSPTPLGWVSVAVAQNQQTEIFVFPLTTALTACQEHAIISYRPFNLAALLLTLEF